MRQATESRRTNRASWNAFVWLSIFTFAGSASAAPAILNLGNVPDGLSIESLAINADGTAIAGEADNSLGTSSFLWTKAGGIQDLGNLSTGNNGLPAGISGDGSVITGTDFNGDDAKAFRWTAAGGYQDIGHLPTGSIAFGQGISSDGATIVGGADTATTSFRPFRWTVMGGMQNLGALPGAADGDDGFALGASNNGSVVVGYSGCSDGTRAFRWTSTGGMQNLGLLPDANGSYAKVTNASGDVVAGYATYPLANGTYPEHAFRWTADGGIQDLRLPAEWTSAEPAGISADGSIIVGFAGLADGSGGVPFIWTPTRGIQDLSTYLTSLGVDLEGWNLTAALGISADGTNVTGWGDFNGDARSFVVTIPEPVSIAALASALAFPSRSRRRH